MTFVAFLVDIANAAQVDLAHTTLDQPIDGLLYLIIVEIPELGKVVQHAIGYHAQSNLVAYGFLFHHQTVHGIVQGRVATHDYNGFVAVLYHHFH